jgi:queuine/archaeosine tRNA-ribosyltransferase
MTKRKLSVEGDSGTAQSEPSQPIRLLLHAVDGAVPYLTPESLQKFFPASTCDRLILGLAVRDTCVVPVYPQGKIRPRGYAFSSSASVDPWLRDYSRVTLPSFDLIDDEIDKKDSSFNVNENHVMTWTSNGRLALTPQSFFEASLGLASQVTLPLYDMIPPPAADSSISKSRARSRAAITRTREWFQHWMTSTSSNGTTTWVPLLVDPVTGIDFEHQIDFIREASSDRRVQGVALMGWKHLQGEKLAREALMSVRKKLGEFQMDLVVLATHSLRQFLLAASHGSTIVGSDLAERLAQEHKALVVDVLVEETDFSGKKRRQTMKGDKEVDNLDDNGCVDLTPPLDGDVKTHAWFSDTSPIVSGCSCFSCRTHSRSYVYHLVCAKELLASMLLMIHNLHHLLHLLKRIEDAAAKDQADEVYREICLQLAESST